MPRLLALIPVLVLAGCGPSQPAQSGPAVPPPPPPPSGPLIEHPDYAAWKRFKPGTVVTRKAVVTRKGTTNEVVITESFRLAALSASEVKVERQKTVERIGEEAGVTTSPPDSRTSPATFPLPTGLTEDGFRKPSLEAKRVGEETLMVLGKQYKCQVFSFSNPTDGAGPMAVKVWWSDDMPGRVVQQTMTIAGSGTETRETVASLTLTE
jgi:hypothetical protein